MKVIKSSGIAQEFDQGKILKVLEWACEGHSIDPYDLLDRIKPFIKDGMTTKEVQAAVIKVAADSIAADDASSVTLDESDFQYVASNLAMFALRKEVYQQFEPPRFYDHIKRVIDLGLYDKEILDQYSREEIDWLETRINHDRDFELTYAGTMQLQDKYLVKDRSTGLIYETPQFAFMLIGMCLHQNEPLDDRLNYVANFYDRVSRRQISLPTPIMAGVRTPTRQFSSCVLIESGDSLDSINASANAIVKYISKRAGIGINAGMIRAEGSKIGHGEVKHTGVIPFWKHIQTAVKCCSQGGIRGGAATMYFPIWHLEMENLIVLKNNKGVDENRIRHMDYGIQINNLMIERYLNNDYITLFSPDIMGGELYDSYFSNPARFKELYEELERDPLVRKKRIKATEAINTLFLAERSNTARLYPSFVDNTNDHGPWIREIAPVKMSNLCAEIALPTKDVGKDDGQIALCTLAAWVLDNFDWQDQDEVNAIAMTMVRALDNLLDYQDYPHEKALSAKEYRSLGVGVTNFAAWLASNAASYNDSDEMAHELFERLQYALIRASIDLAKEKGKSPKLHETKWSLGQLPIDWYKKTVDEIAPPNYVLDWEELRGDLVKYGMRNTTLSAGMPCESSSQVSNSTNGFEPPRNAVSAKQSKGGTYNQVVPNYSQNRLFYDFAWDLAKTGNKGYLNKVSIAQKFFCQAISINTYYNPADYPKGKVPMSVITDDLLYAEYYGNKNMYYHNTYDGSGEDVGDEDCAACKL